VCARLGSAAQIRQRSVVLLLSGVLLGNDFFPDALPHALALEEDVMERLAVMRHIQRAG
jgi:hypothetical protein